MSLFRRAQWYEANQLCQLGIPEPGDRVKFRRKRGAYTHWGIVEKADADGNVSVIHFTPSEGARKAAICRSSLESAANGDLCSVDNSADNVHGRLPTAEIVYRARSQIGNTKYHVLEHNCEVFATWCRNDVFYSRQVMTANLWATALQIITSGVSAVLSVYPALADLLAPSFVLILLCLDVAAGVFTRRSSRYARILRTIAPMSGVASVVSFFLLRTYLRLAFPDPNVWFWLADHYFVGASMVALLLCLDTAICPVRWLLHTMH